MSRSKNWSAWRKRSTHRLYARLSALARPATAFVSSPEPHTIGTFAKGKQLLAGNFLFAGYLIEAPDSSPWELPAPSASFSEELHGFAWLDDLAAVGDNEARATAQAWVYEWIKRYGRGSGDGWVPDLTGRRLIRWINHAVFLLHGREAADSHAFFRSLGRQTIFLSRCWPTTTRGLPRFESLTGLIYAGLALTGMEGRMTPAVKALAKECVAQIDDQGGIPTRNPEELLEVFALLTWAAWALGEADLPAEEEHLRAIERIAHSLRALRHSDGGLARFHGGGRGLEGKLDHALAAAGVKPKQPSDLSMGFARISAGRTSLIVDASAPPKGPASANAHASTCGFELTSGRRPLIVNCGSGAQFGEQWHRAGRATPSHSTLGINGLSSARLEPGRALDGRAVELLSSGPKDVPMQRTNIPEGARVEVAHDGYRNSHGLTHARTLELTVDGRGLSGEDMLLALSNADKTTFERAMDGVALQGIDFTLHFHIYPEVELSLDMGGSAVSLSLKSGEIWIFRHDSNAKMSIEPSVYLENGRLKPRATKQIVLSSRAMDYATRIRWSLAKAQDTPTGLRDLARDDLPFEAQDH